MLIYGLPETPRYGFPVSGGLAVSRGLAGYLSEGWTIGEVTRESIEIIGPPPLAVLQRFYNPDVDQPWITRLDRERECHITTGQLRQGVRI